MVSLRTHATGDKSPNTRKSTRVGTNHRRKYDPSAYEGEAPPPRHGPWSAQRTAHKLIAAAGLGLPAMTVWSALASRWNPRRPGWRSEVSYERLAEDLGGVIGKRQVMRIVAQLEAAGALKRDKASVSRYGTGTPINVFDLGCVPRELHKPAPARTTLVRDPKAARVEPAHRAPSDTPGVTQLCHTSGFYEVEPTPKPPPAPHAVHPEESATRAQLAEAKEPLAPLARLSVVDFGTHSPRDEAAAPRLCTEHELRPVVGVDAVPNGCELPSVPQAEAPESASPSTNRVERGSGEANGPPGRASESGRRARAARPPKGPDGRRLSVEVQGAPPKPRAFTEELLTQAGAWWRDAPPGQLPVAVVQAIASWERYGWKSCAPVDDERREPAWLLYFERSVREACKRYELRGILPSGADPRTYTRPATSEERERARKRERAPLVQAETMAAQLAHDDGGAERAAAMAQLKASSAKKTVHGKVLKTRADEVTLDPPNDARDGGTFSRSNAQNGRSAANVEREPAAGSAHHASDHGPHVARATPSRGAAPAGDDVS